MSHPFKNYPPDIEPDRIVAVIEDQLVPGVQFCQGTQSGDRLVLLWAPETDRLFKWQALGQKWIRIKPDVISVAKKKQLSHVFSLKKP
jgi:hypothetical protein